MKRRKFIKTTAAAGALSVSGLAWSGFETSKAAKQITILHTNDVHSHLDPFPTHHTKYPNLGGASRRFNYFNRVKNENEHTLILDAGDAFQGTPYFNYYGGELEYKVMSKLGYHASTIGNHEFDNGIDNIATQLSHAKFDLLNANYDLSNTSLNGLTKPHQIFEVNGISIGVFGLGIELQGLVSKDLYKETVYLNPIDVAKDQTRLLRETHGCDLVICLSHLGYHYRNEKVDDIKLAEQTHGIDLIIGGHTHTFLDQPTVHKNAKNENVIINQVGWAGINVGRIDFFLEDSNRWRTQGKSNQV
jgi:5'-nucleotidase